MGVASKTFKKIGQLVVNHGVHGDVLLEGLMGLWGWKVPMEEEIADLKEVRCFGELFDGIASVEENAFLTVDERDLRAATGRRVEARVIGEFTGIFVERLDVDDVGSHRAGVNGQQTNRVLLIGQANGIRARHGGSLWCHRIINVEAGIDGSWLTISIGAAYFCKQDSGRTIIAAAASWVGSDLKNRAKEVPRYAQKKAAFFQSWCT